MAISTVQRWPYSRTMSFALNVRSVVDVLPGMNAGASTSAVLSPIEGSGTAWVLLGAWALSPARPTPIHPRHECRGFSALLVTVIRSGLGAPQTGDIVLALGCTRCETLVFSGSVGGLDAAMGIGDLV